MPVYMPPIPDAGSNPYARRYRLRAARGAGKRPRLPKGPYLPGGLLQSQGAAGIPIGTDPSGNTIPPGSSTTPGYDPYPAYNDIYGGLLQQLAAMRDQSIAQLRGDLTGREKAVGDIVNQAYAPLTSNYNTAINSAAAVNDAVANRLQQQGQTGSADLLSKLQGIQAAPDVQNQETANVNKYVSGLGGANYAMDAGDVQNLIGRLTEEKTFLTKEPGMISQQLEGQYASDIKDLMSQYMQQEFGLKQSQAEAAAGYAMDKFKYETEQKQNLAATATDSKNRAEQLYWDNFWKQQDLDQHRLDVAIASGDKATANKVRAKIAADQRKTQVDIANIRAGATESAAGTRATTAASAAAAKAGKPDPSLSKVYGYIVDGNGNPILRNGKVQPVAKTGKGAGAGGKKGKPASGATVNSVGKNVLSTLRFNDGTGTARAFNNSIGPSVKSKAPNYEISVQLQNAINRTMNAYGINPYSKQGVNLRRTIMSSMSGWTISNGPYKGQKYTYDPQWAKHKHR